MLKIILYKVLVIIAIAILASSNTGPNDIDRSSPKDSCYLTYDKLDKPAYDIVFQQASINTLEIYLTKENWDSINIDMTNNLGNSFGGAGTPKRNLYLGVPRWVESKIIFNNKSWEHVGFRLKGNSSLSNAWRSGIYKLPFKLSFDKYEKKYVSVTDQRFYGFKELSASPGYQDRSLIKDKIVSDIFRENGIPAATTAFYKIYIDFGEGLKYCGVYTIAEVIDDTMIKDQFKEEKGNIYKPESNFQRFIQTQFEKKNNIKEANFDDVKTVISALNSPTRTTNPKIWRDELEKVFDVDHFLKYLAINNTIVNWDSYGARAHNYYLYTPTSSNKVTWIPWDFNLSMSQSTKNNSFDMQDISTNWPLIRFLADDPIYFEKYKNYIKDFINNYYNPQKFNPIIDKHAKIIREAVSKEIKPYSYLNNFDEFEKHIINLKNHTQTRYTLAYEFTK
jgi:hypothetical protein